ncbi:hypothetical protein MBLNU230_g7338t1 [Neophaeotheca triangularis]
MPPKFVPRERKHRKLARNPQPQQQHQNDSNTSEIAPSTVAEKDARRTQLQDELRAQQPNEKISGKKRKRLDKYVDSKLRKEENLEVLKKLAANKVDTGLLQRSQDLGRRRETKRERFGRALRERQAGIDVDGDGDKVLFERRKEVEDGPEDIEEEEEGVQEAADEGKVDGGLWGGNSAAPGKTGDAPEKLPASAAFGSGLKRPLENSENGMPVISKRKRRKRSDKGEDLERKEKERLLGERLAALDIPEDDEDDDASDDDDDQSVFIGFSSEEDLEEDEEDSSPSDDEDDSDDMSNEDDDDENGSSDEASASGNSVTSDDKPARTSMFKVWANAQRNATIGFTPSAALSEEDNAAIKKNFVPRQPSPDPGAPTIPTSSAQVTRPTAAVTIPRLEGIQLARLELPVVQEEQKIMEAIHNNPAVVICGATGSGKTTQVPQMMFESGYGSEIGKSMAGDAKPSPTRGMVGVTQPRRVAAVSVAERVATEMGSEYKNRVAHQVRYDTNVSRFTAMKFMTDGILLREISEDILLQKYSAIVIDEAHERSVNTDILIGMLSRIYKTRAELAVEEPEKYYPLKLVIMSATLRITDFAANERLFRDGPPPIVEAEGRQYPVVEHFSRKTQRDFVSEMATKVARGHRKLPPGGMLVFLTGQQEISTVMKQLRETLGTNTAGYGGAVKARESQDQMPLEADDWEDGKRGPSDALEGEDSEDSDAEIEGLDDDEDEEFAIEEPGPRGALKPHILPLYASLPTAQQMRVFQPPPEGSRLIVLATNVAETSLTIPNIRYVFDSGRAKEKRFEPSTGVQTFEVDWVSKASASQRAGRAGRTGPGHCYRLYSSAVYEQFFADHSVPEIMRTPLEGTVLQLKAMEIDNVVNFPFPTPPDRSQLAQAEQLLRNLGAIAEATGKVTDVGKQLSKYPLSPRFGKIMMLAKMNGVLPYAIAIVAALAVGDLFVSEAQVAGAAEDAADAAPQDSESDDYERAEKAAARAQSAAQISRHAAYTRAHALLARQSETSDTLKLLTALAVYSSQSTTAASKFCNNYFLREKGMQETQSLRQQLHSIVRSQDRVTNLTATPDLSKLDPPSEKEAKILGQVVAGGFVDQVAIRADLLPNASSETAPSHRKPRRAIQVAYRTLAPSSTPTPGQGFEPDEQNVYIHPSSLLAHLSVKELPSYIIYSHLSRGTPKTLDPEAPVPKTRLHPLTPISEKALAALAEGTPLLRFGKPVGKIEEVEGGRERKCWVGVGIQIGNGEEWPLGAWRVVQRRVRGDWTVKEVLQR